MIDPCDENEVADQEYQVLCDRTEPAWRRAMAYRTIERAERSGCGKAKMGLTLVDAFEAPSIAPEDRPARSMMVDGEWTPAAKTPPVPLPFGDG